MGEAVDSSVVMHFRDYFTEMNSTLLQYHYEPIGEEWGCLAHRLNPISSTTLQRTLTGPSSHFFDFFICHLPGWQGYRGVCLFLVVDSGRRIVREWKWRYDRTLVVKSRCHIAVILLSERPRCWRMRSTGLGYYIKVNILWSWTSCYCSIAPSAYTHLTLVVLTKNFRFNDRHLFRFWTSRPREVCRSIFPGNVSTQTDPWAVTVILWESYLILTVLRRSSWLAITLNNPY